MFTELIDVKENKLLNIDVELLTILLRDNTTKKNIIWGTDIYKNHGLGFNFLDNITIEKVTGCYGNLIKPRTKKTKDEQIKRVRDRAEVFTPSWVCNNQNNLVDEEWFGYKNVFNTEKNETWKTIKTKIKFVNDKTWEEYISLKRMEISCGEAPYLVSRYDSVTGNSINLNDRIGLLDRKFRILNENVDELEEWIEKSKIVMKSIYGFDWQGDNVLLARENLLYTYIDNYKYKFSQKPNLELIKEIAIIISWNIWQMDGIRYVIPCSCKKDKIIEYTLFGENVIEDECIGCKKNRINKHNGIYCKVMNWETNRKIKFISLFK